MHEGLRYTGLPVETSEEFNAWLQGVVVRRAVVQRFSDGHTLHEWRDTSRLGICVYANPSRDIRCITPYYEGRTRIIASGVALEPSSHGCPWCDLLVVRVARSYPSGRFDLRFHFAEVGRYRHSLDRLQNSPFCVTAWAANVTLYPDEQAQLDAHADDPKTGDGAFIRPVEPKTMLIYRRGADGRPVRDASIYMTAVVIRAREKTEKAAKTKFVHCVAETAGGQFEVILAGDQKPASPPRKGHILEGWFFLTGIVARISG